MSVPFSELQPLAGMSESFHIKQAAQLLWQITTGAVTVSTAAGGASADVSEFMPVTSDAVNLHRSLYKGASLLYSIVSGQVTVSTS